MHKKNKSSTLEQTDYEEKGTADSSVSCVFVAQEVLVKFSIAKTF